MVVDTLVTGGECMCVMESYYYKCHSATPLIPAISDYCDNTDSAQILRTADIGDTGAGDQVTCDNVLRG